MGRDLICKTMLGGVVVFYSIDLIFLSTTLIRISICGRSILALIMNLYLNPRLHKPKQGSSSHCRDVAPELTTAHELKMPRDSP